MGGFEDEVAELKACMESGKTSGWIGIWGRGASIFGVVSFRNPGAPRWSEAT